MSKSKWAAFILFVIAFLLLCSALLSGCKVVRDIAKKSSDSTSVSKTNTNLTDTSTGGNVKKSNTKEENEWWKRTETYPAPAPGVTNVYPSTVVYEGGKGSKETNVIDSGWFKNALSLIQQQLDSTNAKNEEYRKQSETKSKGLGLFFIVLIALGCCLVVFVGGKYLSRFKISKK